MFNLLDKSLGKIGDLIWNKMGDKFYELSGNDLMKEANMMCLKLMCVRGVQNTPTFCMN